MPPTPNGELAKELKGIAENETEAGINFRIVEMVGRSIKSMLQRSNPMGTTGCEMESCLPCRAGKGVGGNCRSCGINYQVECQLCPPEHRSVYHGEMARNLLTRGIEHEANYRLRQPKSFMLRHQEEKHNDAPGSNVAKVTGFARECVTRQVREAVLIRRCQEPTLNGKSEWHQPALYTVQSEIYRY